jgi:hypothetical protein
MLGMAFSPTGVGAVAQAATLFFENDAAGAPRRQVENSQSSLQSRLRLEGLARAAGLC